MSASKSTEYGTSSTSLRPAWSGVGQVLWAMSTHRRFEFGRNHVDDTEFDHLRVVRPPHRQGKWLGAFRGPAWGKSHFGGASGGSAQVDRCAPRLCPKIKPISRSNNCFVETNLANIGQDFAQNDRRWTTVARFRPTLGPTRKTHGRH